MISRRGPPGNLDAAGGRRSPPHLPPVAGQKGPGNTLPDCSRRKDGGVSTSCQTRLRSPLPNRTGTPGRRGRGNFRGSPGPPVIRGRPGRGRESFSIDNRPAGGWTYVEKDSRPRGGNGLSPPSRRVASRGESQGERALRCRPLTLTLSPIPACRDGRGDFGGLNGNGQGRLSSISSRGNMRPLQATKV